LSALLLLRSLRLLSFSHLTRYPHDPSGLICEAVRLRGVPPRSQRSGPGAEDAGATDHVAPEVDQRERGAG
jgi:hypothetical protein